MELFTLTQLGFGILSLICVLAVAYGIHKGMASRPDGERKRALLLYGIGISTWVGLLSLLSLSGFLRDFSSVPPRFVLVLAPPLFLILFLTFSGRLDRLLSQVPGPWLLHLQAFRIPVEILLWMLFIDNLLPERMTFEGTNWDVLSGILGPIFGWLAYRGGKVRKGLVLLYNVLGLLLLFNIVLTAILTFPTPFQVFSEAPGNLVVTQFPIILLPGILVVLAYSLHIFSLRKVFSIKN